MNQLFAALIGLLVGAAAAWVKAVLAIREKVNEELRARRLATYPAVWRESSALSSWPAAQLTRDELSELNLRLRAWYFTRGGLYLSDNSRTRYGELKELIVARLERWPESSDGDGLLDRRAYDELAATCSAFRTALTEDLETRRQRSFWWTIARWRRHRRQHADWRARIERLGGPGQPTQPYPLAELTLPELDTPAVSDRSE